MEVLKAIMSGMFPSLEELENRRSKRQQQQQQKHQQQQQKRGRTTSSATTSHTTGAGNEETEEEHEHEQHNGRSRSSESASSKDSTESHAEPEDPFQTLGFERGGEGVTEADVNKAYRKLALKHHPDKASERDKPHAEAIMARINAAKALALMQLNGGGDDDEDMAGSEDDGAGTKSPGKHRGYAGPSEEEEAEWREFAKKRKKEKSRLAKERHRAAKRKRAAQAMQDPVPFEEPFTPPKPASKSASPNSADTSPSDSPASPTPLRSKMRRAMDDATHDAACGIRVGAHAVLAEVLSFEMDGPLEPLDDDGNTALHYAAYYDDVTTCEMILSMCGQHWRIALLAQNRHGETPLDLAKNVGTAETSLVRERLGALHAILDEEKRRSAPAFDPVAAAKLAAMLLAFFVAVTLILRTLLGYSIGLAVFVAVPVASVGTAKLTQRVAN
ncbi:chaperone protein DnaJ [Pycnococcus provasolii]